MMTAEEEVEEVETTSIAALEVVVPLLHPTLHDKEVPRHPLDAVEDPSIRPHPSRRLGVLYWNE
jgi:hypothetical protein